MEVKYALNPIFTSAHPRGMLSIVKVDLTSLDPFRNLSIAFVDLLGALGENNLQSLRYFL
jgi:hypothetical protein